ncbi:hypothetical protein ACFWXO_38930 [Kitasatospora sp. NPDC059088]|uniref:hypothetical protein n=1 Tax=Kitasatospora sp. NPDC059088 TaxID=3346722 RepID=UPI0036A75C29
MYDAVIRKGALSSVSGDAAHTENDRGAQAKQRLEGDDKTRGTLALNPGNAAFLRSERLPKVAAAFGA